MYRGKLRLPLRLRSDLTERAQRAGTNRSALIRGVLEEYVNEPEAVAEPSPIVPCIVLTGDEATWQRAEAKAHAQGLTLSMALRPRLDQLTREEPDA